jgi:cytochrome c oxidase subunit 4
MTAMAQAETTPDQHGDDHEGVGHVVPLQILIGVFVALIVLTWLTVAVTAVDLGSLNLWVALAVATIKGSLVVLYFMHLRYDSPFNSLVFVTALVFLFLFLGITIMDTIQYHPNIEQMMLDQAGQ